MKCVGEKDLDWDMQPRKGFITSERTSVNTYGPDRVQLDLSRAEFASLLLSLGYAAGAASKAGDQYAFVTHLLVSNVVNEGKPDYRPYNLGDELDKFNLQR